MEQTGPATSLRHAAVRTPSAWVSGGLLAVALLSLLGIGYLPLWIAGRTADARAEIERAENVRAITDRLEIAFAREVAGIRGYVLTGDALYVDAFEAARRAETEALAALDAVHDVPALEFATPLAALLDVARAWHVAQDALLEGRISRTVFTDSLRLQQQRYETLLQRTADLREAANRAIGVQRAGIRADERQHRRLTMLAAAAATLCLVVLIWFAWRAMRTAAALRASDRQFRATFEHAAVGIAHVALDGSWLQVNRRLCEILGYTPEQLSHLTFQDITHPEDLDTDLALTARLRSGEIPSFTMQKRYFRADGSVVWCNLTAALVRRSDDRPEYFVSVLEDITDRIRLETERTALLAAESDARARAERDATYNRLLQNVTSALSEAMRPEDVAEVAVDRVATTLGARYGFIVLPVAGTDMMEVVGAGTLPDPIPGRWARIPVSASIPLTAVYRSGVAQFLEVASVDALLDPVLRNTLRELGIRSSAVLPLLLGDRPIGAMTFDFTEPRRFGDADRDLLRMVAHKVAQALDRARLFEAEQLRTRQAEETLARLHRLQSVTAALTGALTRDCVASVLARQGRDALDGRSAAVALLEPGGLTLEFLGWDGYPADARADWEGLPVTADTPLTWAVRSGEPCWLGDESEWRARFGPVPVESRSIPSRAWAAIPLVFEGRALGGFVISFAEPRTFGDEDRSLGLAIAQLGAQALERARLYEDADTARMAAEAGVRSRDRFLAATSHELRSPLTELIGSLEALRELPGDAARVVAGARSGAWRFAAIVDSMLALADVDASLGRLSSEPVDIAALARELVRALEADASARGLTLRVDAPDALIVHTDPRRLRPIVYHLLDNAVRFATPGLVRVAVGAGPREITLSVADEGPGIPHDRLHEIFQPFTQIETGHTRRQSGVGIGLALARRFARQLGGDLSLDTAPGRGSTFTLQLVRAEGNGARTGTAPHGARVLVVDDEAPVRAVVQRALRREGYIVEERPGATEALDLLEREPFDIVVTDISMPDRSGLWLADRIREGWPGLAVILMSGAELTEAELAHATRVGCPFISKPFEPRTLVAVVAAELAARRPGAV